MKAALADFMIYYQTVDFLECGFQVSNLEDRAIIKFLVELGVSVLVEFQQNVQTNNFVDVGIFLFYFILHYLNN